MSLDYLNYDKTSYEGLIGKGRERKLLINLLEKFAFYAAEVSDITLQLNYILQLKLEKSQLYNYFLKIEMPLVRVLIEMEYFGTFVDSKIAEKNVCPDK